MKPLKTRPDHAHNLAPHEINLVIDNWLYTLTQEARGAFMDKYPTIYNAIVGRDVVVSVNKHDSPERQDRVLALAPEDLLVSHGPDGCRSVK